MIYKCGNCGFIGYCYGVPTSQGVSAPFCTNCQMNDKLKKIKNKKKLLIKEKIMAKIKKVILGLIPQKIHNEKRFYDVCSAINRYYFNHKKIPIEWIKEYNELLDKI